ncbi:MAG: class I SAM-dependent methyltransferase [Actinomycetaceae bacterium]|nr:class I SAM-dependent methyltransferase [Arcanobacterium sp.]MDD7686626.1 class I SAM-dependent methyltransferase [Actinomycetaceae bacterium]MDY5273868.1 class I SAM-dependent methyltransferase [Arcanobacterium sp.]
MAQVHEKAASWLYAEEAVLDQDVAREAREHAAELGIEPLSVATCAFLTSLATLPSVRTIAEVGTGTGVSGLALLAGSPDSTLTSIDVEPVAQNYAREAFAAQGVRSARFRLIGGRSADLLPRLASASYDLVLIDGDPLEAAGDAEEALRMLKAGGILLLAHALNHDLVADPVRRDAVTVALRDLGHELLANDAVAASLLPLSDGILLAAKKSSETD